MKSSVLEGRKMSKLSRLPNNAASELQLVNSMCHVVASIHRALCPYAWKAPRQRDRPSNNPGYEVRVQGALEHVASRIYTSLREAAREEGVSRNYLFFHTDSCHIALNISRSTLSDRAKNRHVSFTALREKLELINPSMHDIVSLCTVTQAMCTKENLTTGK